MKGKPQTKKEPTDPIDSARPARTSDSHVVAITSILILIFVVIAIIGIIQEYSQQRPINSPTQSELQSVHSLLSQRLNSQGDNISQYDYKVFKDSLHIYNQTRGIEVELTSNTSQQIYIIDLDKMAIIATQQTLLYADPAVLSPRLCSRLDLDICHHH